MKNYLLTSTAEKDIEEIIDYIAQDNPMAALKIMDKFFESMEVLAEHPQMGHKRIDITTKPVRFWPISHYIIIYKDTHPIEVLRILSGYRDITNMFF